jgi:NAD(P)-dependent dehydrogenase (short-subunit alcohol dehydrogenase family)
MPTVLITGSNRGIGLALARQYAGDGWRVLATCRDPDHAKALRDVAAAGEAVSIHRLDVTGDAGIRDLAAALEGTAIDVLFNNAGVMGPRGGQNFGAVDHAAWLGVLEVNLLGPVRIAEAFVDHVAASGLRTIAVVSSTLGSIAENASGGYYLYRTSKAAVNMAVRCMAASLRSRGITLVTLHPGWVRTDMGGPAAAVSPEQSAAGLRRVVAGLRPRDSGRFLRYDGTENPW